MATAIEAKPIGELMEDDCFFFYSPEESERRQEQLLKLDEYREFVGMSPLTGKQRTDYFRAAMESHVVYAVVRKTGERWSKRLSDGQFFLWHDGNEHVQFAHDNTAFMERLEEMRAAKRAMEEEQRKAQKIKSKKARRELEQAAGV